MSSEEHFLDKYMLRDSIADMKGEKPLIERIEAYNKQRGALRRARYSAQDDVEQIETALEKIDEKLRALYKEFDERIKNETQKKGD